MTTPPPNTGFALPTGLSEDDLIDWIESDARARVSAPSGSGIARVERALVEHPHLRGMLDAMRVDRAALGALETPAPPAWMARAILEEHERQALLALSDVATLGPRRAARAREEGEAFTLSAMPGWFRPALAAAAVLALVFGAWQLLPLVRRAPAPVQGPEVAQQNPIEPARPIVTEPEVSVPQPPVLALGPVPTRLEPSPADRLARKIDMPVAEALALARAGRLVLVVDVRGIEPAREAASALARVPTDASWRLREPTDALIAAMTGPDQVLAQGVGHESDELLTAHRGPLGQFEIVLATAPTVYLAQASATPQAMLQLVEALDRIGGDVRLVVLDEPLPGSGAMPTPAIPGTLLWWDAAPDAWHPWAGIPVRFIEAR